MSDDENLFGEEHVRVYQETGGERGYHWRGGTTILLLTTRGRSSGQERTTPLIHREDNGRWVIVASKGGAPDHPGWFKNLSKNPAAHVQIKGDKFPARARVAEGDERERLWRTMNGIWPHYDEYAQKTDREIPVVVLERG